MKRVSLWNASGASVDAIGDWWSLLIVRDAFDGARRFGEYQSGLGISKGVYCRHDYVILCHEAYSTPRQRPMERLIENIF